MIFLLRVCLFVSISLCIPASQASQSRGEPTQKKDSYPQEAAQTKIVLWNRNFDSPYMRAAISNLLDLSVEKFGTYELQSSDKKEQGRAFADLSRFGDIDIFVGGTNLTREQAASVLYIPIDRGLLGFRLCLTHEDGPNYKDIDSVSDLIALDTKIGLGTHWPDRDIFQHAGFLTVSSSVYENLFNMLASKRFECFSRSLAEIGPELASYADLPIKIEPELVFIYPSAEFIFVNRENRHLYERLQYGFEQALENGSFYRIFNEYYEQTLIERGLYERKLIILENKNISDAAKTAINQHGVASFIK